MVTEEPWTFAACAGRTLTTPHYRIHTTIEYERVIEHLPGFLEGAFTQYTRALGTLPAPPTRLEVYLLQDRRQWEAKTRQVLPREAATLENLGRGGFTTDGTAILYYLDWGGRTRDTFAIASHEGWHQYTQTTFRHPLPVWLEEGIATYMEGHRLGADDHSEFYPYRNGERRRALGRALYRGRMIPFDDLLSRTPQSFLRDDKNSLLTYYAQVWALTLFLVDGGEGRYRDDLAAALADAASGELPHRIRRTPHVMALAGRRPEVTGRTGPWLILAYFTKDLKQFEADYLAFVRRLVRRRDLRR